MTMRMRIIEIIKTELGEKPLIKRLISAISFGVGGAVGSRVLMLFASILVSQFLDGESYGKFSLLNTTVTTFVTLSGGGIGATLTQYIALSPNDSVKTSQYIGTLRLVCFIMSLVVCACLFIFVEPLSIWLNGDTGFVDYLNITSFAIMLSAMSSIEQSIQIGFENYKQSAVIQIIRCFVYLVLATLLSKAFGINGAIFALVISHAFQYILSRIVNEKEYKQRAIHPQISFNRAIAGIVIKFTVPAVISSFFISPTTWFVNSLLAKSTGYIDTAIFSIAYQWMTLLIFIPSQMSNVRPIYTEMYAKKDYLGLKRLFLRVTIGSTCLITPIAIVVMIISDLILRVYGEEYVQGNQTMRLMALAAIIFTLQSQVGTLTHAIGKMWVGFAANLLLCINTIGIFYLLKDYGSAGLSVSYCASYLIHCTFYFIFCFTLFKKSKKTQLT